MSDRAAAHSRQQRDGATKRRFRRACCRTWPVVFTLLGLCGFSARLTAQEPAKSVQIIELRAGFSGHFKVGYWTPFEVVLRGGSEPVRGHVELVVLDGDAVPTRVRAPDGEPLALEPGEEKTVLLDAKIGQLKSDVTVGFRSEGRLIASRRLSTTADEELIHIMPSGQELIVWLGAGDNSGDQAQFDERRATLAHVSDPSRLPVHWWGYEGVDAVVLVTGQDEIDSQLTSNSPQMAALDQWVRMGGRLIWSAGKRAETVLAPDSQLARFAPGTFASMVPLRQSTMLETYADTSEPLEAGSGPFSAGVPKLQDVRGSIEAYAGGNPRDLPLVVRTPHGFGEVVFVAFDLESPALVQWSARPQLFDKLLRKARSATKETDSGTLGQVTTLGFVDLSGQLRSALDQIQGVQLVPFWLVAVLVLVYIVCIGPLDYFLVKKVLGRMEATWITFTLTVVLFSAGAYALAYQLKGGELRTNQIDLVDFDAESKLIRGTSWSNLFSPRIDEYDISLSVDSKTATSPTLLFSWLGLPGNGFGGMNPPGGAMPLFTEPYDFFDHLDGLRHVPMAIWSSKTFVGRWWSQGVGQIEADLSDKGKLVGTLTSHLDEPLDDAVLIYQRWAYPLRQLKPGQFVEIETQLDPQTVETYLRHVRIEGDHNVSAPYDRASLDVPRIVQIMSAHELAGGEGYTGLVNQYQSFVDMSGLVKNGRVILIGRRAKPAAELTRDGQPMAKELDEHWTFYRYVFPVREQTRP